MDTTLSPPVGHLLGDRYHVGSRIARGGMATVYLGTDTRLDRVIAIKIAHPDLSDDSEFVRRFISEARSAALLSSPNVVAVYDQGSDGRLHYIAMEYVPGRTLRGLLTERGRLSAREALDIMAGVLSGLAAAHQAGLAHRDVKPENVLLTATGGVKVADFGLARSVAGSVQTQGGMIIGTAAYLAPEQVSGGTSDARTDVYAAGVMLFELVTGAQPHTGPSPLAVAYKHVTDVVPVPSSFLAGLSPALDALVAMATSRDPELRPANAGQFLRAVQDVRNGHVQPATAPYPTPGATTPGAIAPGSVPYQAGDSGSGIAAYPAGDRRPGADPYPAADQGLGADQFSMPGTMTASMSYGQAANGNGGAIVPLQSQAPGGRTSGSHPGEHGDGSAPGGPTSQDPSWGAEPDTAGGFRPPAWEPTSGVVVAGASALPSLSPQSAAGATVLPAPADSNAAVNHTLIVAVGGLPADYPGGIGYRDGAGYRDGSGDHRSYRGRRVPRSRSEPWLQRLLFSRRFVYLAGAVALLLVIALIGWWLTSGQYTLIPQLRGVVASTAQADLSNLGLHSRLGPAQHSALPKGDVITTRPAIGAKVTAGSIVTIIVSLGPVMIDVPNVTGQPLSQAEAALRHADLTVGKVSNATSPSVALGDVIITTPRAFTSWPQDKPVGLTVSAGPGLPSFVGGLVAAAQTAAQAGGYTINPVPNAHGTQPLDTITSQSPSPNTPITPGEVVTVHFSPGPPAAPVPNVQGMSVQQAIQTLRQAGFNWTVNKSGFGNKVCSYSPTTPEPKGTVITLSVGGLFCGF